MIKSVIFDLDGVLVDTRELHYDALNRSLEKIGYTISRDEHLSTYDGLPTDKKLELLTQEKGLPPGLYRQVWDDKQTFTRQIVDKEFTYDDRLRSILSKLRTNGIRLAVCSNSIRETTKMMLVRRGFLEFIEFYLSNEDVVLPKPNPEMFLRAMIMMGLGPKDCLIVEDSYYGRSAALDSGAHLCGVENSTQVTFEKIEAAISRVNQSKRMPLGKHKWQSDNLQIVIPIAGEGKSFQKAGYSFPKYLVDIAGKPMIQWVTENIAAEANYIFIVLKDHYDRFNLSHMLNLLVENPTIVVIDGATHGAAETVLDAEEFINNEQPLVIVNSDQYMEWNSSEFFYAMAADNCDGGIVTFESTHPKYSFVRLDDEGFVVECAEKKPISRIATAGVYYFRRGSDFVEGAKLMIKKDIRTNDQFFVCPVYNELISKNMKIRKYDIDKVWSFSVPEEVDYFVKQGVDRVS